MSLRTPEKIRTLQRKLYRKVSYMKLPASFFRKNPTRDGAHGIRRPEPETNPGIRGERHAEEEGRRT
jgi:hypothetical protein